MRLNKNFLIHNNADEAILVPTGKAEFSGVVRGNKTFGSVLVILHDGSTGKAEGVTEDDIVADMKERFDAPDEVIRNDVKKVIAELRKIGAIED